VFLSKDGSAAGPHPVLRPAIYSPVRNGTELWPLPHMTVLFEKQVNKINLIVSCKAVGMELRKSYEDVVKSKPPKALAELMEMLERLERAEIQKRDLH
jgi:hypothetical protein